jgi:hypothetical protein
MFQERAHMQLDDKQHRHVTQALYGMAEGNFLKFLSKFIQGMEKIFQKNYQG